MYEYSTEDAERLKRNLNRLQKKLDETISILDEIGHPKASRVIIAPIFFGGNLHVYRKQYSESIIKLQSFQYMQSKLKEELESGKISENYFWNSIGLLWIKDIAYADIEVLIEKLSQHRSHKSVMYRLMELSEKIQKIIELIR